MTTTRVADVFVESVSVPNNTARVADVYVEAVAMPTTKARVADVYVEVVVGGPLGWTIGVIEF